MVLMAESTAASADCAPAAVVRLIDDTPAPAWETAGLKPSLKPEAAKPLVAMPEIEMPAAPAELKDTLERVTVVAAAAPLSAPARASVKPRIPAGPL